MIPKIIHYTWFSGEEFPEKIKKCIESWHKILPDYELHLWDMKAIENIDSVFLKEAILMKKWAYAADMVRCYAVYNYGGIYLDTDVEVFKSFDEFLDCKAFIGKETVIQRPILRQRIYSNFLTSHCFGAEKGHHFIKDCLDYYLDRHFILSNNPRQPEYFRLNMVLAPYIQYEIALQYGYDPHPYHQVIQKLSEDLVVYPSDYFSPDIITNRSICKHWAVGGWMSDKFAKHKPINTIFKKQFVKIFRFVFSKFNLIIARI